MTSGTGFGSSTGLRINGKIFAMYIDRELILKLPASRVGELVASGRGRPWGPGARTMKEWVAVSEAAADEWGALTVEARSFVDRSPKSR